MTDELLLRRKWTLRAHGRQVVFVKKAFESDTHVLMKALLWALYLPAYPGLTVEVAVGDRYKPDVVALDARDEPLFWGEAGDVTTAKIRSLTRRYRNTHFALAKWDGARSPCRHRRGCVGWLGAFRARSTSSACLPTPPIASWTTRAPSASATPT